MLLKGNWAFKVSRFLVESELLSIYYEAAVNQPTWLNFVLKGITSALYVLLHSMTSNLFFFFNEGLLCIFFILNICFLFPHYWWRALFILCKKDALFSLLTFIFLANKFRIDFIFKNIPLKIRYFYGPKYNPGVGLNIKFLF